ncbi:MAG: hypothetical protein E7218_05875 [Anaerofustis stercorihominis]|nr:hypothetical protein [Anaerofustis stercorihominis]
MFLVAVILLAVVVGYIRKGSLSNVIKAEIRVPFLFVLALLLFLVVEAGNAAGWEVIIEYAIWIRFLAHFTLITSIFVNIQTLDIWPLAILIGSVMNFTAIFSNVGRMPVSARALEIAGIETAVIEASNYFELAGASTSFSFLGGIIPIPLPGIFAQVISIGTLLIAFGAFGFIQELMLGIEYIDEDDAIETSEEEQVIQIKEPVLSEDVEIVDINESVDHVDRIDAEDEVSDEDETEDDIKAAILGSVVEDSSEMDLVVIGEQEDDSEDDIDDYDDYDGYFDDELDYEDEMLGDLFKEIDEQLAVMGRIDEEHSAENAVTGEDTADTYELDEPVSADAESEEPVGRITDEPIDEVSHPGESVSDDFVESVDDIDMLIEGLSEDDFDDSMFEDDLFSEYEDIYIEDMDFDDIGDIDITEGINGSSLTEESEELAVKIAPEGSEDIIESEEVPASELATDNAECSADEEIEEIFVDDELAADVATALAEGGEEHVESSIDFAEPAEVLPEETVIDEVFVDTADIIDSEKVDNEAVSEVIQHELVSDADPTELDDEFAENTDSEETIVEHTDESCAEDIDEISIENIDIEEPEFIIEGLDEVEDIYSVVIDEDDSLSEKLGELIDKTEEDSDDGTLQAELIDHVDDDTEVVSEEIATDIPDVLTGEQFVGVKSDANDESSEDPDEADEELEAIFRAILSTDDELISESILSSDEEEKLMEDVVTLEYANAASFFEELDRNEAQEYNGEEDLFEKIFADDTRESVSDQVEEVLEQLRYDESDASDVLKSVGETVESVSNELKIELQEQEVSILPQTDSQYIVIDGKIVENPNYKLRRSSKNRFATEEERKFGDISSGRRRNKSANKGKFSVKEDE